MFQIFTYSNEVKENEFEKQITPVQLYYKISLKQSKVHVFVIFLNGVKEWILLQNNNYHVLKQRGIFN